jgi:hypothetical protein
MAMFFFVPVLFISMFFMLMRVLDLGRQIPVLDGKAVDLRVVFYWGVFGDNISRKLLKGGLFRTICSRKKLLKKNTEPGTASPPKQNDDDKHEVSRWPWRHVLNRGGLGANRNGLKDPKERAALQLLQRLVCVFVFCILGWCCQARFVFYHEFTALSFL